MRPNISSIRMLGCWMDNGRWVKWLKAQREITSYRNDIATYWLIRERERGKTSSMLWITTKRYNCPSNLSMGDEGGLKGGWWSGKMRVTQSGRCNQAELKSLRNRAINLFCYVLIEKLSYLKFQGTQVKSKHMKYKLMNVSSR